VLEKCDWSGGYLYKNAYYQGWHPVSYIVYSKFSCFHSHVLPRCSW
jgi:hypothetical protein